MNLLFPSKFAPRSLLILVPPILGVGGVVLSQLTGTNIGFAFPSLLQIAWSVLLGLLFSSAIFLGARVFIRLNLVLDWVFEDLPKQVWALLLISGLVSLGEELFFRGFLQPNLGLLATSLAFSVYHLRTSFKSLVVVPFTFFLGLVFGQSYLSTASIFVSTTIHFLVLSGLGIIYRTFPRKAC